MPPKKLPLGWKEAIDPRNGKPYYYHTLTRKSVATMAEAHGLPPPPPEPPPDDGPAQIAPLPGPPPGPPPPIDETRAEVSASSSSIRNRASSTATSDRASRMRGTSISKLMSSMGTTTGPSLASVTDELYDEATAEDRSWVAGKVVCVSGATGAMGKAFVRSLCSLPDAGRPARLLLVARDSVKAHALRDEVVAAGVACAVQLADMSRAEEVMRAAATLAEAEPRVHCLVHMAGIWAHARERCEQADGLELHFMVNYLATVLLTEGLLRTLRASAQADGSASRVVAVGSAAVTELIRGELHLGDLQLRQLSVHSGGVAEAEHWRLERPPHAFAFAHSELLLQLWVRHCAATTQPQPHALVSFTLCEPGLVDTPLTAGEGKQQLGGGRNSAINGGNGGGGTTSLFRSRKESGAAATAAHAAAVAPRPPTLGCEPVLHLACAAAMDGLSGRLLDWGRGGPLVRFRPTTLDCFPGHDDAFVEVLADPDKGARLARATDALVATLRSTHGAAAEPVRRFGSFDMDAAAGQMREDGARLSDDMKRTSDTIHASPQVAGEL